VPNRRRGAQPGNQNARTHGLYARALSDHQAEQLARAREADPTNPDEEIALLRARLATLLEAAPERFDLVIVATRAIAHLMAVRARLQPADAQALTHAVERVVGSLMHQLVTAPTDDPP